MIRWLSLSDEERRNTIAVVAEAKGLPENAIEKDWWVTLVLRAVFSTPLRPSLLFKGGTSLSKGWDLIERLSEDIDLALNRDAIGAQFAGDISNRAIGRLREESHRFVREEFQEALLASFAALNLSAEKFSITQDKAENADPHLLINYQSLYEPSPYLPPRVKIEISTRSLMEPWTERSIRSFIGTRFSDQDFADSVFEVPVVEPRRTFLEKAFLLHEEFLRERDQIKDKKIVAPPVRSGKADGYRTWHASLDRHRFVRRDCHSPFALLQTQSRQLRNAIPLHHQLQASHGGAGCLPE